MFIKRFVPFLIAFLVIFPISSVSLFPRIDDILPKKAAIQVFPRYTTASSEEGKSHFGGKEEKDYEDWDEDDEEATSADEEETGRSNGKAVSPPAIFWTNALGPFLYGFENADRRRTRNVWRPAVRALNRMRRKRMGSAFRELAWDQRLANQVRGLSFTQVSPLSAIIQKPVDGISPNLVVGIRTMFSALLWRNIVCSRGAGECRAVNSTHRIPVEFVDAKARRIGCNARLFKEADKRELRFAAACATDRTANPSRNGSSSDGLVLFVLAELQNARLRRKLRGEAVDEIGGREDGEEENEEDEVDDDSEEDEEGEEDEEEDEDEEKKNLMKKPTPKKPLSAAVSVQAGDIVRARADAIVDPIEGALFATLLQPPAEEATERVLGAESVMDLLEMDGGTAADQRGRGMISEKELRKQIGQIRDRINSTTTTGNGGSVNAERAKQKLNYWLKALKKPETFEAMRSEMDKWLKRKGKAEGAAERIIRAGGRDLKEKLREIAQKRRNVNGEALAPGEAVATAPYNIRNIKAIIHTVPPPADLSTQHNINSLIACYRACLRVAVAHGFTSIAFPSMMPRDASEASKQQAARIGVDTVAKWSSGRAAGKPISIIFMVYNNARMLKQYQKLIRQKLAKFKLNTH